MTNNPASALPLPKRSATLVMPVPSRPCGSISPIKTPGRKPPPPPPCAPWGNAHEGADALQAKLEAKLQRQQELLYGAGKQSVLVVLQGMDTAGKDGTIKHVM